MFHKATIGLSSFNATTSPKLVALSKATAKFAEVFGVLGAMFSIIMEYTPSMESDEFKLMKDEFSQFSERVDVIARSLNETKSLIKLEAQKSAYIKYENSIHNGYSNLESCLKKLGNVSCSNLKEC